MGTRRWMFLAWMVGGLSACGGQPGIDTDAGTPVDGGAMRRDGGGLPPEDGGPGRDGGPLPPPPDASVFDYCNGRVTDQNARTLAPLAKPAAGTWVMDPEFGTQLTRITQARSGEAITPVYSTVPAWNSDGSILLLYRWGGGHVLYDGNTLAEIGPLDCTTSQGASPSPSDVEHVMWDPNDPNAMYFPEGSPPILYRCNVRTHDASIVHDFSSAPTSCQDDLGMGEDPQWFPGDRVGLACGGTKWIYDMRTDEVFMPRSGGAFGDSLAPIVAPSGTLAYYGGDVYDVDLVQVRSLDIANAEEHANIGRSAGGHDFYYAVDFDGDDPAVIQAHDMQTGMRIPLVSESLGWGYPPGGIHITSVVADPRAAGWVLASVVGDTSGRDLLALELVLANVDTGAVCRVGRHRSFGSDGYGYEAEPHPVFHIRPDGTLEVLFGSDWGGGGSVDSYLLRVPPG